MMNRKTRVHTWIMLGKFGHFLLLLPYLPCPDVYKSINPSPPSSLLDVVEDIDPCHSKAWNRSHNFTFSSTSSTQISFVIWYYHIIYCCNIAHVDLAGLLSDTFQSKYYNQTPGCFCEFLCNELLRLKFFPSKFKVTKITIKGFLFFMNCLHMAH